MAKNFISFSIASNYSNNLLQRSNQKSKVKMNYKQFGVNKHSYLYFYKNNTLLSMLMILIWLITLWLPLLFLILSFYTAILIRQLSNPPYFILIDNITVNFNVSLIIVFVVYLIIR